MALPAAAGPAPAAAGAAATAGAGAGGSSWRSQGSVVGRDLSESKAMLVGMLASGLLASLRARGPRSGVDLRCVQNTWQGVPGRVGGGECKIGKQGQSIQLDPVALKMGEQGRHAGRCACETPPSPALHACSAPHAAQPCARPLPRPAHLLPRDVHLPHQAAMVDVLLRHSRQGDLQVFKAGAAARVCREGVVKAAGKRGSVDGVWTRQLASVPGEGPSWKPAALLLQGGGLPTPALHSARLGR